jgi:hypothetical protein
MAPDSNPALRSITWRGLLRLFEELQIPELDRREFWLPPFNTHDLRPVLQSRQIYPPRDFPHLIQNRLPDVFVTYDWREQVLSVSETIRIVLEHCLQFQQARFPRVDLNDVLFDGVTFWLDWVFLDQSSRNVDRELDQILPVLFEQSALHLVASTTALSRAWCCYELAQFNRNAHAGDTTHFTSLVPADLQQYPLWGDVRSTDPEDKQRIEKRLVELFPGGLHAMEALMVYAGLAADQRAHAAGTAERIFEASGRWVERFVSSG